jgi:hypothetical protein
MSKFGVILCGPIFSARADKATTYQLIPSNPQSFMVKTMLEDRNKWIRQRFGNIDESVLGNIDELDEIAWPNLVETYEVKGKALTYRMISDIEQSAERIAEIFSNGAYEMIHNSEIEWHQQSDRIIEKVCTGNWNFYGCYLNGQLIAAESMYIIRGDRIMEWVWGCVDPVFRGSGVWRNIGEYTDKIVEKSGAQIGSVWVVTTHKYSQMALEKAGYVPMGCFVGKRLFGGADNKYYRHTLIHYAKIYGKGKKHLQNRESMLLTEKAAKLFNLVFEIGQDSF